MNLLVVALIVASLEYYKISIKFIHEMVTKKNLPHVAASIFYTFIILIVVYVTEKLKKQISVSGNLNWFQTFFIGASLNPTLGPINIKLALYRYSFLLTVSFEKCFLFCILFFYIIDAFRFCTTIWLSWTLLTIPLIYIFMLLPDYK